MVPLHQAVKYLLDTNILVHYVRQDALFLWIEAHYALTDPAVVPLNKIDPAAKLPGTL